MKERVSSETFVPVHLTDWDSRIVRNVDAKLYSVMFPKTVILSHNIRNLKSYFVLLSFYTYKDSSSSSAFPLAGVRYCTPLMLDNRLHKDCEWSEHEEGSGATNTPPPH
jgi:hypothetical protein